MRKTPLLFLFIIVAGLLLLAQTSLAQIHGVVKDTTGGVIPHATITLTDSDNHSQTTQTDSTGTYNFSKLAAGTYSVAAAYPGMQQASAVLLQVAAGQSAVANISMTVQAQKQEVTVESESTNRVSTEPANNLSALVLKAEDLDALPDDPDDLTADLEALAGPSAGPGGTQIFVDGFSGGRLPPKASIREIRINSNPFSAEYDKMGSAALKFSPSPAPTNSTARLTSAPAKASGTHAIHS